MDPLPTGIDEHGRRSIEHVPGCDLLAPRLKAVLEGPVLSFRYLRLNGEDRADRHVHVDVRGAVQRIENQDILPLRKLLRNRQNVLGFLGDHATKGSGMIQGPEDHVLSIQVELLDTFALDVGITRASQDVHDTGLVHFPRDNLGSQGDRV